MINRFWFSTRNFTTATFMHESKEDQQLNNVLSLTTTTVNFSTIFWVLTSLIFRCLPIAFINHFTTGAKSPVVLELPHQWLWEIIDEFVYQFQSFALFRCSLHKKSGTLHLMLHLFFSHFFFFFTAEELEFIRINPTLWNIHSVLNVLYSLVDKSNINQQLEVRSRESLLVVI